MSRDPLQIFWEGPFSVCSSFAVVNRAYCEQLLSSGNVDLTTIETAAKQDAFDPGMSEALLASDMRKQPLSLRKLKNPNSIWVSFRYPIREQRPPHVSKWIGMYLWEYSQVPISLIESLDRCDEVWTSCEFSYRSMIDSGFSSDKLHVMPLGFDPKRFHPNGPSLELPTRKSFRILYAGGTIYRKGIDVLLKAYQNAFSKDDDVSLVVKELGNPHLYSNQSYAAEIEKFRSDPNNPELVYLTETYSDDQMAALNRACHVAVYPYRGEGFCLPALEAAACGTPVIATEGGPTDEFLDPQSNWKLSASPLSVGDSVYGMPCQKESFLFDPNADELSGLLQDITKMDPKEIERRGMSASAYSHEHHTWKHATQHILDRLAK